jgi:chromosome segregation ATPase
VIELTIRQREGMRRIGSAVDALVERNATAGRSIEAIREQRRRLIERAGRIDADLRDPVRIARARLQDPEAAAEVKKLEQERPSIAKQIESAERSLEETQEQRSRLVSYSAPLRETWEALLRYTRMSAADFGIASGEDVPRTVRADVTLSERP